MKITKKRLNALKQSIQAYEQKIIKLKDWYINRIPFVWDNYNYILINFNNSEDIIYFNSMTCPCCILCNLDCAKCPIVIISKNSDYEGCLQTPWDKILSYLNSYNMSNNVVNEELIELVQDELNFLKKLYKKGVRLYEKQNN